MNQSTITLIPNGGIGNRIRVISSGLNYAKKRNSKLNILWKLDEGLNCNFEDLFLSNPNIQITNQKYRIWDKIIKRVNLFINFKSLITFFKRKDLFFSEKKLYSMLNKGYKIDDLENYFNTLQNSKNVTIECCWQFYPKIENINVYLQPKKSIQDSITEFSKKFNPNTIGVHIRRTDNVKSIQFSSIDLFIQKMDSYIELEPNIMFFLSTDETSLQIELEKKYQARLIYFSELKSRNSKNGLEQALVDMYLLSKTNKILGSYWSTFSLVASEIGNIDLEIVSHDTENLKPIY